jgi:hypothetical protein
MPHLITLSARASTLGGIVKAHLLRSFQVDDQFKLRRLLPLGGMDAGQEIQPPEEQFACAADALSFDDFIRPRQHVRRNCEANFFGRFQINDQFEFSRLLHRQIRRFGAFENFIHKVRSSPC